MGDGSSSAHGDSQGPSEGGDQALDVSGVDHLPPSALKQGLYDL